MRVSLTPDHSKINKCDIYYRADVVLVVSTCYIITAYKEPAGCEKLVLIEPNKLNHKANSELM